MAGPAPRLGGLELPALPSPEERERGKLLAELVPLLESRGYDAGDVRAALGG